MILFEGKLLSNDMQDLVLEQLWDSCVAAVSNRESIEERVIEACGKVAEKIRKGVYRQVLEPLLETGVFTNAQLEEAIAFFDKTNLQLKYQTELGVLQDALEKENAERVAGNKTELWKKRLQPLGILFHIAAGNAEGLPFFSVIEGLLAGNVNILKLPSADDGISIMLLHELIKEAPELAPYICVLDVPSTDVIVLKKLADMADAIVVWGGDSAVNAVRSMASPNTQIISWGHKLSFAYVSVEAINRWLHGFDEIGDKQLQDENKKTIEKQLCDLAHHICQTRQLLCSSCQGVFLDTEDERLIRAFAEKFLHLLEEVNVDYPKESVGVRGKIGISLYNEELESVYTGRSVLRGKGVSVTIAKDSNLVLSFMFKNCWVKPLPREQIISQLKGKKGYLQTVGLICGDIERVELSEFFVKAGLTHIVRPQNMSQMLPGGTHDGEYPLRRYTRIVELES